MSESNPDSAGEPKEGRSSVVRATLWAAIGIALIIGIVLYFRYARQTSSLL